MPQPAEREGEKKNRDSPQEKKERKWFSHSTCCKGGVRPRGRRKNKVQGIIALSAEGTIFIFKRSLLLKEGE